MQQFEQYWLFAVTCFIVAMLVLRLVLRERVTLQSSMWFLVLLSGAGVFAIYPGLTVRASRLMGFELPSNFFFALGIGGLALMHVHTLIMLSRAELRTITLTQDLALLREQVERLAPDGRPSVPSLRPSSSRETEAS